VFLSFSFPLSTCQKNNLWLAQNDRMKQRVIIGADWPFDMKSHATIDHREIWIVPLKLMALTHWRENYCGNIDSLIIHKIYYNDKRARDKHRYKPVCKSRVCKYVVYYISSPFNCRLRPSNVLASSPFVVRHSKARSLALAKVQATSTCLRVIRSRCVCKNHGLPISASLYDINSSSSKLRRAGNV